MPCKIGNLAWRWFQAFLPFVWQQPNVVLIYDIHRASYIDIQEVNGDIPDGPLNYQRVIHSPP